ncbi:MAG: protease Lon-related BREX system protein BrxL [Gudongella sp.]|nr:protease Lon-related BREX system protein BrxL [Gudongella sp.]
MDERHDNEDEIKDEHFEDDFESFGSEDDSKETIPSAGYLNDKLNMIFEGKIVRKDLTKKIKEGANVPVYVLEYLLGMYCATQEEEAIVEGVKTVKRILAENFVRPDEAQKVISKLRERGTYTVIDKISVKLNYREDRYEAEFSNLGISNVPIAEKYASDYERLLGGGIWCIVQLEYFYDEADKSRIPFIISKLTPIQMPNLDLKNALEGRARFTKDEWIDVLLRSIGMEPSRFTHRVKMLLLIRMIPLVENNFNLCELGPRGTGKSHVYKEISPNSILVSGGQTTVANLFYNMSSKTVGLVGIWDCVAFDEVAGIKFKDYDGIQIMKDYMASGSFSRGKEEKNASASMVFVGNINQSVDVLLKTSHLFDPFPETMAYDSAFFDRMHCYLPGWEIPKYRPEFFTNDYGLITDYLSEFLRELRKSSYADAFDQYFKLGNNLNQRDVIAVRKMVSGLVKLIYPHGVFNREDVEEILRYALESRRRVKEQLKKIGGMEFYDVNFSYIDNETFAEEFVPVPEQGGGKLIPEGIHKPGQVYTVSRGKSGMLGVYKLETEMVTGSGKFERTGLGSDREAKESIDTAYRYLKANSKNISGTISMSNKDYLMHLQDLNGVGITNQLSLAAMVGLCSAALHKPLQSSLAVLGSISISGTIIKVEELANVLQVCLDSGAKKVLLPITSAVDMSSVPPELMGKFNLIFYQTAEDAVFKALGVE